MDIVIGPEMFSLNRQTVEVLFQRRRELFDREGFDPEDFRWKAGLSDEELLADYWNAVMHEGLLYFLSSTEENALRTDPWLVEQVRQQGVKALLGPFGSELKIVTVPDEVQWHIEEWEDGSERVRENGRAWQ